MEAGISTFRHRRVNEDGTLGDWSCGGTPDIICYDCENCDCRLNEEGELEEES